MLSFGLVCYKKKEFLFKLNGNISYTLCFSHYYFLQKLAWKLLVEMDISFWWCLYTIRFIRYCNWLRILAQTFIVDVRCEFIILEWAMAFLYIAWWFCICIGREIIDTKKTITLEYEKVVFFKWTIFYKSWI